MRTEDQIRKQLARERLARRRDAIADRVSPVSARRESHSSLTVAPAIQQSPRNGLFGRFAMLFGALALVAVVFFAGTSLYGNQISGQAPEAEGAPGSPQPNTSTGAGGEALATAGTGASASSSGNTAATRSPQQETDEGIDRQAIAQILSDDELVDKLVNRAKESADAYWIATHVDAYASDGYEVQHKILKLAAEEPAATTYVRNWPESYPAYEQDVASALAMQTSPTGNANVPMLYQWDPRWAYTVYSSTTFGLTGCCPTTFAMVYQGVTGNTDLTPYDMGMLAQKGGYMATYEGTDANFLINEAAGLGMNCTQLVPTATALIDAIESGKVIIANVGPGDFTTDGHFIVLTGVENGKLIVNDPYSKARSEMLWDPDEIIMQTKLFLAYEKL